MPERRKCERRRLYGYYEVYDDHTGGLLGRVVDMSEMGAMMISKMSVEVPQSFACKMRLHDEIDGSDRINFDIESLWCLENNTLGCYQTGYQIVNISDKDLRLLKRLLQDQPVTEPDPVKLQQCL